MVDTSGQCKIFLYDYMDDNLSTNPDFQQINFLLQGLGVDEIDIIPTYSENIFDKIVTKIEEVIPGYWVLVITSSRFRNDKKSYQELQKKFSKAPVIFVRRSHRNFQTADILQKNYRYFHVKKKISILKTLFKNLGVI